DRPRLCLREMLLAHGHRRGLHAVDGEHPRARRGNERMDDREVESVRLADPTPDGAGDEAFRRSDAHTRMPFSRSPAVSSRPSARFAFWIAWPAAPFPRLSSAQTTMVV